MIRLSSVSTGSRRITAAALVAAPAIAAILWIGGLEAWRLLRPDSPLFAVPAAASLGEAIQDEKIESAFAFIRSGEDPNQPISVSSERLTGGRTIRVSPLLLAVAVRNNNAVRMLIGFGARAELAPDVMAACLADTVGDAEIANLLRTTLPFIAAQRCPPRAARPFPLLDYAAR